MTRYDLMKESVVKDEITGDTYPDPLSYNYNDFEQLSAVSIKQITEIDLNKFWLFALKNYADVKQDIILNLNNVDWLMNLLPEDDEDNSYLVLPSETDIAAIIAKNIGLKY